MVAGFPYLCLTCTVTPVHPMNLSTGRVGETGPSRGGAQVSDTVNLNDVGALTRSGQGYGTTAEDNQAESRNFASRMEASQQGLRGAAGGTFSRVADTHGGNLTQLANQIAEQAVRAVRGERTIVTADEEADSSQGSTAASVDGATSAVSRPITV
jgi:hypothetical protein